MIFAIKILALCTFLLAASASYAGVHQFSTCQPNEGKSGADAAALLDQAMAFNGDNVEMSYTILWPFYGSEREQGAFVIQYQFENFDKFGDGLGWLWDEKNFEREDSPNQGDVFSCSQHQVLWEYPVEG